MACEINEFECVGSSYRTTLRRNNEHLLLIDATKDLPSYSVLPTVRQIKKIARKRQARRIETAAFSIAALIAIIATFFCGARVINAPAHNSEGITLVNIAPGDTLWSIAARSGDGTESTAQIVDGIRSINPVLYQGGTLKVGEKILVPASGDNVAESHSRLVSKAVP